MSKEITITKDEWIKILKERVNKYETNESLNPEIKQRDDEWLEDFLVFMEN